MSFGRDQRHRGEPTLPLINIVFLMLIFFLVSAQMARPLDPKLNLVQVTDPEVVPPPDALVLMPDGQLQFRGAQTTVQSAFDTLKSEQGNAPSIQILPDARSDAQDLIVLASKLEGMGAQSVRVVTERSLR